MKYTLEGNGLDVRCNDEPDTFKPDVIVDFPEPVQVIKIDPAGRYAVVIESGLSHAELASVSKELSDWWRSGEPFIIINAGGGVRFERVDGGSE